MGNEKIPGKPLLDLQVISTMARSAFSFFIGAGFGPYTAAITVLFSDNKQKLQSIRKRNEFKILLMLLSTQEC